MKNIGLIIIAMGLAGACARTDGQGAEADEKPTADVPAVVRAAGAGPAVEHGAVVGTALWVDPEAPGDSLVLAAAEIEGVVAHTLDGRTAAVLSGPHAAHVVVVPDVPWDGERAPLVVVYDLGGSEIVAHRLDRDPLRLRSVTQQPILVEDEVTGLCHYRSRLSGSDYLYAVTDRGYILHYELYLTDAGIGGRLLRTIPSGKGSGFCAVDSRDGTLYVSEEETGVWGLDAEPEGDTTRRPLDLRAPFGGLGDDLKGVAVYQADADTSYLVVSDAAEARLAVRRLPGGEDAGAVSVEGVGEADGMAASAAALGPDFPGGLLAIANEGDGGSNLVLVDWRVLADTLGLAVAAGEAPASSQAAVVRPVLETENAKSYGDAADDPAIWVHPEDPSLSLVIGTDKQSGLYVYDLEGRLLQSLPDGQINNVDVRYDFPLGDANVAIVAGSNRSDDSINVYRIDAGERRLVNAAAGTLPTGFSDPYGSCMYRSAESGEYYVFINEGDSGEFRQWRLFDDGAGRVAADLVREFPVGSQTEGCVADDELGHLYVGEEDVAIWKFRAEPDGGETRVRVDATGEEGNLTDDVEGLALWIGEGGSGYLVASNQGANNYAVYRRQDENAFIGIFHVVADAGAGVDGASETDGLAVSSAALGEAFPQGLLVVQDGRNIAPEARQNFKYVSWADVAEALQLE